MPRVTINEGAISRLLDEIQARFDQRPIIVPMQADPSAVLPSVTHVNIHGSNSGPIVSGNQTSASVGISMAVSAAAGSQGEVRTAEIVADVLRLLPSLDVPGDDRAAAEEAGQEILTGLASPKSDDSTIRKAWVRLRGALAPAAFKVLTSTADAGADEAGKLTRSALEALMHHTL